jgi:hypothetical protein
VEGQRRREAVADSPVRAAARRARRFVLYGIVATVGAGSLLGAVDLACLHFFLAPVRGPLVRGHAYAQLFAFVLPVALGMSFRLLPPSGWRAQPRLENAVLALVAAGSAVRFTAYLASGLGLAARGAAGGVAGAAGAVGAGLVLGAAALHAAPVGVGLLRRRPPAMPEATALAALALGLAAAALDLGAALAGPAWAARLHEATYAAFLDGFAVTLVAAILLRMGPSLTGGAAPRAAWLVALAPAGAAIEAAALLAAASGRVEAAGTLAWAAGAIAIAVPLSVVRRAAPRDRATARLVRVALGWLGVALALRASCAALALAGRTPHALLLDAARHAFTVGFLAQLIFAMLARLVPAFEGRPLALPRLRTAGAILLNAGAALRLAQAAAAIGSPAWTLDISGASGGVAWLGVALLAVPVLATREPRGAR